jgi:hypothetical protein
MDVLALGLAINVDTVRTELLNMPIREATSAKYRGSEVMGKDLLPVKSLVAYFEYFMPSEEQYPDRDEWLPDCWMYRNYRGTFCLRQWLPRLELVTRLGIEKYVSVKHVLKWIFLAC